MVSLKMHPPEKPDPLCGVVGCRPKWLQKFNNMAVFMVCFIGLAVIYGMSSSYTSSMIPSIEKRFGFSSKYTGILLAMNDVAHIAAALLTAHFGGKGHRPRWISVNCFLLGLSLFLHASPEIFFPLNISAPSDMNVHLEPRDLLCSEQRARVMNLFNGSSNTEECEQSDDPVGPLLVLGAAHLLMGIGSTALLILGLPFIDDNTEPKDRPIYFAVSFSGRIFGPVLGYLVGAYCNTIYVNWTDPGFSQTDPRWISAWYLGYLYTGAGLCLFALAMGFFPRAIRRQTSSSQSEELAIKMKEHAVQSSGKASNSWREFGQNIKRLLCNVAFVCRCGGSVCEGLIIAGYMGFLPKFIALQYQVSQSTASLAGGVPGVLAIAMGVMIGGFIIRRFSPEPRHIALALTFAGLVMTAIMFGIIGLGCEEVKIFGFGSAEQTAAESLQLTHENRTCPSPQSCGCPETAFQPVCDPATGTNYYSPCHAGCRSMAVVNETKQYLQCSCVKGAGSQDIPHDGQQSLIGGLCPKSCPNLYVLVVLLFVAFFLVGLPMSGQVMLLYRIVPPDLKSLATGVTVLFMSGLGLLPGPILAGLLVDSSCKLWQVKACGEQGYCLLYSTDNLRWNMHLAIGLVNVALLVFAAVITYKVWDMKFDRPPAIPADSTENCRPPSPPIDDAEKIGMNASITPTFQTFDQRRRHTLSRDDPDRSNAV